MNISNLRKKCKNLLKKYSVVDFIIFGSVLQGKHDDIDIGVLLKDEIDFDALEKEFSDEYHITYFYLGDLFSGEPVWKSLLHEGVSVVSGKRIAEMLGFDSVVMYKYDSSHLQGSSKVKFYYALKGRDGKSGIVKMVDAEMMRGMLIVPVTYEKDVREFFMIWKIPFERKRMLVG